jgi:hypothetical protein
MILFEIRYNVCEELGNEKVGFEICSMIEIKYSAKSETAPLSQFITYDSKSEETKFFAKRFL